MIRYTTPTVELIVEGIDLTPYEVYVTFKQHGRNVITFDHPTMEYINPNTKLYVTFNQKQSALFKADKNAEVQVNWTGHDSRNATEIANININRQLLERVIDDN